ncbi:hypothetical protein NDA10_001091 [Ustilago hordei]|uniref:ditrans,polycis-polyprenyl diphosphate synthase [(2E,6E)-farnesyldiphosphate specific] n=1 Tax=Ustilago hordei TaxID=120017 RepID=I2FQJ4_USTHO|nr:uncharacterized protein UHO2_05243 [Ustilago hordei]KAJ1042871.1 hypothetical protein NDA10_001091 [Ustilago hordei]UTT90036.1 hypothetical protein NDA17_000940 [Ustilago hordei]CCF49187.1 uncharacterized protein UHOR_07567 [Ustilago hordei]SYW80684.1 uncharacterized protein UHO2_05243 [Ustilago hordei]
MSKAQSEAAERTSTSRSSSSKPASHLSTPAPTASNQGLLWLLLRPFLALAFAIFHIVYQIILVERSARTAIKDAFKQDPNLAPASYTSLQHLVDVHETPSSSIRVPEHLAVVLADAVPSSIRLYVSRMLMRISARDVASTADLWRDFRYGFQAAVEAKHVNDMASIVHLARVSGVQQLSVYTTQQLSPTALQSLSRVLQVGYSTQAVIAQQEEGEKEVQRFEQQGASSSSRYAELRRRRTMELSASWPASSGSEAGLSSLDETLASSYTADVDQEDACKARVDIRLGLATCSKRARERGTLQVTLLSQQDGQERFAQLVSQQLGQRADAYLLDVLQPDMAATPQCRFSSSSLRKAWLSKRKTFTSELTVAALDKGLVEAGYMCEPDLLVVFGGRPRLRKLYGFPAWPMRLTDLFYDANMQPHKPYRASDFVAALRKLAKTQQRYGR